MVAATLIAAGLGALSEAIGFSKKILDRTLPGESKKLRELETTLVELIIQRKRERKRGSKRNDEWIQESYLTEEELNGKIKIITRTANAQLDIILAGLPE